MTASSHPGLRLPKPRPRALDKADKRREREAKDKAENAKVKRRSGGQCEVCEAYDYHMRQRFRCAGYASQIHHLIGGRGRRNVGRSILAEHKIHVCRIDHDLITRRVLEPSSEDAATVTFTRRR